MKVFALIGTLTFVYTMQPTHAWAKPETGVKTHSKELTAEARETMAQNFEKMASCFRDKAQTVDQCHKDMMESCKSLGKESCPMMGGGMHDSMHK